MHQHGWDFSPEFDLHHHHHHDIDIYQQYKKKKENHI